MKSVWQDTARLPRFPQLKKDIHTDVLIIGGGIAGILIAYSLHQAGVKYMLVEKETICSGTTQNTTAKITYQHGLIYHKILKSYGIDATWQYLYANKMAFDKYAELYREINCDYELSYTGKSCFDVTIVRGYKRVPAPPAKIIPFISFSIKVSHDVANRRECYINKIIY